MNEHDQDPFAKYDKLFEEHDKKSIVKPSTEKKAPSFDNLKDRQEQGSSKNVKNIQAVRVIMIVFFVVLAFQAIPIFIMNGGGGYTFIPIFSFIFIIVVINILIKAFKR